ncbi:MAG: integrase [Hyphomicrobiaceae bacterium]|nr:integrase [Hyphomicrobiaceae bacterium]
MDRKTIFGGNPLAVIVRLFLLSVVVGVVLSALGITPRNFLFNIEILLRRIYDLGFSTFDWLLQYLLLGAMVVVPIWLVARIMGAFGSRNSPD